jgi:hypothetical protein
MGSIHEKNRGRNSGAIIPLIRKEPLRKDLKEEYADVAVRSNSPVPPPLHQWFTDWGGVLSTFSVNFFLF